MIASADTHLTTEKLQKKHFKTVDHENNSENYN